MFTSLAAEYQRELHTRVAFASDLLAFEAEVSTLPQLSHPQFVYTVTIASVRYF
jgi:hypothetical protein